MMAPGRNGMQRKIITGAGKWGRGDDILIISGNVRLDGGSCAGSTCVESNSSKALSLIVIIHLYLTYVLLISANTMTKGLANLQRDLRDTYTYREYEVPA